MRWAAPIGLALLLTGAGLFFATQDLGRADQWASVASFLLALAVAGVGVVLHLRRRETAPEKPTVTNNIHNAGAVFTGPTRADITIDRREARRKKRNR